MQDRRVVGTGGIDNILPYGADFGAGGGALAVVETFDAQTETKPAPNALHVFAVVVAIEGDNVEGDDIEGEGYYYGSY